MSITIPKTADGAIVKNRIVKRGTASTQAAQATSATETLVGVYCGIADASSGATVLIHSLGLARVELGGSVSYGTELTADSDGKAVAASPSAGVNNRVIGWAVEQGSSGQVVQIVVQLGRVQG